jgi:hypothetical protein
MPRQKDGKPKASCIQRSNQAGDCLNPCGRGSSCLGLLGVIVRGLPSMAAIPAQRRLAVMNGRAAAPGRRIRTDATPLTTCFIMISCKMQDRVRQSETLIYDMTTGHFAYVILLAKIQSHAGHACIRATCILRLFESVKVVRATATQDTER